MLVPWPCLGCCSYRRELPQEIADFNGSPNPQNPQAACRPPSQSTTHFCHRNLHHPATHAASSGNR